MFTLLENPMEIHFRISSEDERVSEMTPIFLGFICCSTDADILDIRSWLKVSFGIPLIPSVPKYFFNELLSFCKLLCSTGFL